MCSIDQLKIDLKAMNEGLTALHFDLGDAFFETVNGPEIRRGTVSVDVNVQRSGDSFKLDISAEGTVHVPCDICLDDMQQPIEASDVLVARLGGEPAGEDSDLTVVDKESGMLDISWFVYETIALSIPIKHVHEDGECNPEMLEKLHRHMAGDTADEGGDAPIDPRWSELAKLKTII